MQIAVELVEIQAEAHHDDTSRAPGPTPSQRLSRGCSLSVRARTRGLPSDEGTQDWVVYQSFVPKPRGLLFAEIGHFAQ